MAKESTFTAKRHIGDSNADAVFQKHSGVGGCIVATNAAGGLATITVDPADTADLDRRARPHELVYDLELRDGANVYTLALGTLRVSSDVTVEAVE